MYFPDRGCVHTLLTLYVYGTEWDIRLLIISNQEIGEQCTKIETFKLLFCFQNASKLIIFTECFF